MYSGSPTISVIIPSLNSESSIRIAVDSILKQSFDDLEIIVIDGGSNDSTISLIEKLGDFRIKIFEFPGSGIYDAMNKGIKLARGKWLYFMGSDDVVFDNQVFSDIVKFISTGKYDVVYGNVAISGEVPWAKGASIYGGSFNLYRILRRNICHQAIFYRCEFLKKNKLEFNTEFLISADWDLNIKCFLLTRPKFIDRTIANFTGGGKSSRQDDNFARTLQHRYQRYWKNPFASQPKRSLYWLYQLFK